MTLGNAAAAHVRLIIWCLDCHHQVEPDPGEMAERHGPEMTIPDWHARLVCGECGSRQVDMVVSGTERRWGDGRLCEALHIRRPHPRGRDRTGSSQHPEGQWKSP